MSLDELLSCNQKHGRCKWLARYCLSQWIFSEQLQQSFFETIFFPKISGVGWLYWAFSIDEHPSNPPFKLAVWCKSMQVNILRDFTEITMHVLQGQHTPKNPELSLPVWTAESPFYPLQFDDGNIFLFQADIEYRTGHISLLIQQPLIIMGHEKTRLAYSQSH